MLQRPKLPYTLVAGAVPCGPAWLVASAKLQGTTMGLEDPHRYESFLDVLDDKPSFSVIALAAPVGYLDGEISQGRSCERDARLLLGKRRAPAVKSAPTRTAIESSVPLGFGIDAITRRLLPRYREVASTMAPHLQRTVFEVHPELSFYQLNGDQSLQYSKHRSLGAEERRKVLEAKIQGVSQIIDARLPRVREAHLLDVAACLWTARRIFARAIARVPEDPEWDSEGLRMELVR